MKRAIRLLVCLFLLSALTVSVSAASSVPSAVIKAVDSVVRIEAEFADGWATGSGFVIESSRDITLIATNYHVVEGDPQSISVWLGEDESIRAEIVLQSESKDLCILKLAYPVSLKALRFDEADLGEAIYAVGFPAAADDLSDKEAHDSRDATLTDGIVSAFRSVTIADGGSPVSILQINAAINSGNSGGPLFNEKGRVVGINTYGITDAQGIFGAIAASELEGLLAQSGIHLGGGMDWLKPVGIGAAALLVLAGLIALLKKCRPLPVKKLAAGALVVLLLLAVGGYTGTYLMARSAAAEGDFEKADSLLLLQPLTALHDGNLVYYVAAGGQLAAGDYEGAKAAFAALSGYMDADTMVLEADYRYAEALLEAGEFDEAIEVFTALSETGYKDAEEKVFWCRIEKGNHLLHEANEYKKARDYFDTLTRIYTDENSKYYAEARFHYALALQKTGQYVAAYNQLKEIEDYTKAVEIMPAFKEAMYQEGVKQYRNGDTTTAFGIFDALSGYSDSDKYTLLIYAKNSLSRILEGNERQKEEYINRLMDIFYFEDVPKVLGKSKAFLQGEWESDNGKYLNMSRDGAMSTNLPGCEGEDNFDWLRIGSTFKENSGIDITALAPDCIEIFCYQNGQTYTLYRQ